MANEADHLIREIETPQDERESMDILLQLTLPIVLILAFLMVTELKALQDDRDALERAIQNTPSGGLLGELEGAVLTLQHQLLLKATDEIAQEERDRIGISEYRPAAPSVADVLARRINERFKLISTEIVERFSGPRERQRTQKRLRQAVEERFEQLALAVLSKDSKLDEDRRGKLLAISDENRKLYQTKLEGHIKSLMNESVAVQLEVIRQWIRDSQTSKEVERDSRGLWARIQGGNSDQVDRFVNLKVQNLVERFTNLGIPLLDETREKVL